MSKVRIKVDINNSEENNSKEIDAIISNNKLKYKEDDKTTVVYSYLENILIRENNELRMNYFFDLKKESTGNIYIKELNKKLEVKIKTTKLKIDNNNIEISFIVEDNKFNYKVEVIK